MWGQPRKSVFPRAVASRSADFQSAQKRKAGRSPGATSAGETLTGQVTATHYRVEGVKSGISVVWKTMG